jgi:3-oxoacyl-[acyl-carrier-protein] synthase III
VGTVTRSTGSTGGAAMDIKITATAVSADPGVRSSIEHASIAANDCLRQVGVRPDQVDVLINTGVYRDSNMAEPAMAALIQKNVGMNLDYVKDPTPHAGFSFDLMNGACGALNAVQVAGAFLTAGNAEYVLVVSSDAHPAGRPNGDGGDDFRDNFPYATVGAAMLLQRTLDEGVGFGRVHTAFSTDASDGTAGYIDMGAVGPHGREKITVCRDDSGLRRLAEFAAARARGHAEAEGIDLGGVLLVASQPTPTFAADVARLLGIEADAVATVDGVDRDPHSSALTFAYHQAVARGQAARYPRVLFLAAGAGPSVACSFYRPGRQDRWHGAL